MIQMRSVLTVADNTGARKAMMISRKGAGKNVAGVGDIVTVHVKDSTPDASVKKGEVTKAVVVRTAKEVRRDDGTAIRFDRNAAVILNNNNEPRRYTYLWTGCSRTACEKTS